MPSFLPHIFPPSPQGQAQSLSVLVQQLTKRDKACEATRAIVDMADSAWDNNDSEAHAEIIAAGALPPLVALLSAGSSAAVQEQSAWAIFVLAFDSDSVIKIIAAGAIPPLVALLGSHSTATAQEVAAMVLQKIAAYADSSAKIAAAGAIPLLVTMLGAQSAKGVQEAAAGALWHLSAGAIIRVKVIAAGAIPPLVSLLSAHFPGVQEAAAAVLCNLAIDDDNTVKIADAGAIPPLVAMLKAQSTAAAQLAAAKALSNFTDEADKQVVAAGAIPPLVALLGSQSPDAVQEAAAAALRNIASASNANSRFNIADSSAIPPLVALLGARSTSGVQLEAAGALQNLAATDNIGAMVAAAGAIPPLVALLGAHNSSSVQEIAAQALGNLALNVVGHAAIKSDPRALSFLSELQSSSASVAARQAAERALRDINKRPPFVARSVEADMKHVSDRVMRAREEAAEISVADANPISAPASPVAAISPSAAASQQLPPPRPRKSCWSCGATGVPLKKCSVCVVAVYCGAGCQRADWKAHKGQCAGLKAGATTSSGSPAEEK